MKPDDIKPTHNAQLYPSGKTLPANLCLLLKTRGANQKFIGNFLSTARKPIDGSQNPIHNFIKQAALDADVLKYFSL